MLVCGFTGHFCPVFFQCGTGDWKVASTRRLESLRYIISGYALKDSRQPSFRRTEVGAQLQFSGFNFLVFQFYV
jgi:hypothetical protein